MDASATLLTSSYEKARHYNTTDEFPRKKNARQYNTIDEFLRKDRRYSGTIEVRLADDKQIDQ